MMRNIFNAGVIATGLQRWRGACASVAVIGVLGLTGCASDDKSDLMNYVNEVKSRPAGRITPLPEFKGYESYTYKPEGLRDPFKAGSEEAYLEAAGGQGDGMQPDLTRNKEPLESFPLDALQYVGHLEQGGKMWAIVTAPDGYVYRVQEGNYLGQNYGRIIGIGESQIDVRELVSNGLGGWTERDAVLAIAE